MKPMLRPVVMPSPKLYIGIVVREVEEEGQGEEEATHLFKLCIDV